MRQRRWINFESNNNVNIGPFLAGTTYQAQLVTPGIVCILWLDNNGVMREVTVTYDMDNKLTISKVSNMKSIGA